MPSFVLAYIVDSQSALSRSLDTRQAKGYARRGTVATACGLASKFGEETIDVVLCAKLDFHRPNGIPTLSGHLQSANTGRQK